MGRDVLWLIVSHLTRSREIFAGKSEIQSGKLEIQSRETLALFGNSPNCVSMDTHFGDACLIWQLTQLRVHGHALRRCLPYLAPPLHPLHPLHPGIRRSREIFAGKVGDSIPEPPRARRVVSGSGHQTQKFAGDRNTWVRALKCERTGPSE